MAALKARPGVDLTEKELLAIVDERAQQLLGMSGEEFIRLLEAGSLPDSPAVTHLAMLLGEGR